MYSTEQEIEEGRKNGHDGSAPQTKLKNTVFFYYQPPEVADESPSKKLEAGHHYETSDFGRS